LPELHSSLAVEECARTFAFLEERYGFSAPETKRIGNETFVLFHKGMKTISISWEIGSAPLIELFYPPSSSAEKAVPWASREGTPRTRRFPRIRTVVKFDPNEAGAFANYIKQIAAIFLQAENDWIVA
jgi:hypothetical protein